MSRNSYESNIKMIKNKNIKFIYIVLMFDSDRIVNTELIGIFASDFLAILCKLLSIQLQKHTHWHLQ